MKVQHPKELEQLYTIKFGTNIRYVSFEINILCPVLCFNHSQMGSKPISRESCCIYCLGVVFTSLFIDTCLFFCFVLVSLSDCDSFPEGVLWAGVLCVSQTLLTGNLCSTEAARAGACSELHARSRNSDTHRRLPHPHH